MLFSSGIVLLCSPAMPQTKGERALLEHRPLILDASTRFNFEPRILAAIIFTEQEYNMKPGEETLDYVFARAGYNSSIGVAQIKVETARWLESALHTPSGRYFLGKEAMAAIPLSPSTAALIDSLQSPAANLRYAAAYLAIIQKVWKPVLDALWSPSERVAITATLYSRGLIASDGAVREPHPNPVSNDFGRKAQAFYESFQLKGVF